MFLLNHDGCYIISFAVFNEIAIHSKHIPLIPVKLDICQAYAIVFFIAI